MIKKVESFQTSDGQVHATYAAAEAHQLYLIKKVGVGNLSEILERVCTPHNMYSLSKTIFPFNSNDYWHSDTQYERRQFCEEMSEVIIENWPEIKKAVEGQA